MPPYDGWGGYPSYDRKPARPVKGGGLRTKNQRGQIGETWWSTRWVEALEAMDMGARLDRGRSYARRGQVAKLTVDAQGARAKVQGSRPHPYDVTIRLKPLDAKQWNAVLDALSREALFAAELLAGEMPRDVDQAFKKARASLFPTRAADLVTDCSCPDWANPCKHVAAVHYILAERLDEDPFLLFLLRGAGKEAVLNGLRKRRSAAAKPQPQKTGTRRKSPAATPAGKKASEPADAAPRQEPPLPADPAAFWALPEAASLIQPRLAPPAVARSVLLRLGDAPFGAESGLIVATLARAYDATARWAVEQELAGEPAGHPRDESVPKTPRARKAAAKAQSDLPRVSRK